MVGYTVIGAFIFQAIEDTEASSDLIQEVQIAILAVQEIH